MPSTTILKPLTISELQALVTGIPKYCPNVVLIIAGQTYTAAQAVTFLESILNAVSAVATAKTGWVDARTAEEKLLAQDGATVKALRANIALMFSNNVTTLAALEITPKKPHLPLSAEARLAATAKMKATRLARGITSKKQKATISGNVTGVTITPITTPSAAPTATSPSATAPAATSTATTPTVTLPATPAATNGAAAATAPATPAVATPHP